MNESSDQARVIVNPFVICGGTLLVGLLLQLALPLPFLPPAAARLVGAAVFLLGFVFGLPAARLMRQAGTTFNPGRPTTAIVIAGPYRFTRNPIYVAILLNYAGVTIFASLPWALLFLPAVVWMMTRWVIIPEETYLERKFGEEYRRYMVSVRRWI